MIKRPQQIVVQAHDDWNPLPCGRRPTLFFGRNDLTCHPKPWYQSFEPARGGNLARALITTVYLGDDHD